MPNYDVPAVDAPKTKVDVPQEEAAINKKLATLATKIEEYKQLADFTPGSTLLSQNPEVVRLIPLFEGNEELKEHARLLWTQLQDAQDSNSTEDKKTLVLALDDALADFEDSFCIEEEETV